MPSEEPAPADVDDDLEPYQPVSAEPIDWTPDRAGTIVRAGGYLLHTADSMAREPEGEELWRATEADIDAIGAPLARILNRYEPTRRVAGYSDEGELILGVAGYARRNLALRGRIVTAKRQAEEAEATAGDGPAFGHTAFGEPGPDERQ